MVVDLTQQGTPRGLAANLPPSQPIRSGERRTRKSVLVAATGIALMAASLTACSTQSGDDYAAVCIDQTTQQRVDDGRCGSNNNGALVAAPFLWYYMGRSASRIPAVGQTVTGLGGTTTKPASGKIGVGYPREGAAISKNGFGNRSKTFSGGGSGSNNGGGSRSRSGGGRSSGS